MGRAQSVDVEEGMNVVALAVAGYATVGVVVAIAFLWRQIRDPIMRPDTPTDGAILLFFAVGRPKRREWPLRRR